MDPNLLPFVERVGVPAVFLLLIVWGAGNWFKATSERALGLFEKGGAAIFPLVVEMVRASATTAQRTTQADEKLNNMGTRLDWHHDEMVKASHAFGSTIDAIARDAAAAREAAESAAEDTARIRAAIELEVRIPQARRDP